MRVKAQHHMCFLHDLACSAMLLYNTSMQTHSVKDWHVFSVWLRLMTKASFVGTGRRSMPLENTLHLQLLPAGQFRAVHLMALCPPDLLLPQGLPGADLVATGP